MKKFILIGMPGVGKSFWANELGLHFNYPTIDLDQEIENQEGMSISDIFKQFGEPHFRSLEQIYLKDILHREGKMILASGGGTPCFDNNIHFMKEKGITIYLKMNIEKLERNLLQDNHIRPVLKDILNIRAALETILDQRKIFYEQADYIIDMNQKVHIENFREVFLPDE